MMTLTRGGKGEKLERKVMSDFRIRIQVAMFSTVENAHLEFR